jgi:hypothetical protein
MKLISRNTSKSVGSLETPNALQQEISKFLRLGYYAVLYLELSSLKKALNLR